MTQADAPRSPSRRRFLGGLGGLGAGVLAAGGAYGVARGSDAESASAAASPIGADAVPFYGQHQAGIGTPAQDRLMFAAFDVTTTDVAELTMLLRTWSAAAAQMTAGQMTGPTHTPTHAPPADTGEAEGLAPSQLTITVGFGPSLFDDRFGLKSRRPEALVDIPAFGEDALDPARSDGDLCIQACANDPMVAFHAVRNMARMARGAAVLRWSQLGFGRTSGTATEQATPRNLMGFKDGTNNVLGDQKTDMRGFVWVGDETDQPWMRDGSYAVIRRIRMLIESWDADPIGDQEAIFGRKKSSGAPLTGTKEFDAVDLSAVGPNGPVIPMDSHIRVAAPSTNGGQKILRRGYSYTDGVDSITGQSDAGLFFVAFMKDARRQFIPLQRRLDQLDKLNEYIRHTTSGIYAIPPGLSGPGDFYGKALFT